MTEQESEFTHHEPCESCGSSDAKAVYTDGHTYCFACADWSKPQGENELVEKEPARGHFEFIFGGEYRDLPKRGISEKTCRKFGYQVGTYHGQPVQIAPFHDSKGSLCAQHVRFPNKDFVWIGEPKQAGLWGQHLWRDNGKMVVITEGEIDAMSISQLQDNRWPVVSLKSGAQGGKKDIAKAIDWLNGFESVVLAFDMDDPGRQASKDCAVLLTPGKARVWKIPLKDANEMLVAGWNKELLDAIWGAKVYRPDGIVSGTETWDLLMAEEPNSTINYPWVGLQEKTLGMRRGEIVTFCAGSGVGKSQVCRELAVHLMKSNEKVGVIALEESVKRSIRGLVSILVNAKLHIAEVRKSVDANTLKAAWDLLAQRVYFYDHWGSIDGDNLLNRIRYLAVACGCSWIVLDHISIVVSGNAEGDERRNIDNLMTKLRSIVEELGIGLALVSHLKRPDGKPLEEGGQTSLALLRGSGSIGQLSDIVIGQERDQQDAERGHITTLRVLKNRFNGETGVAGELAYDGNTGRLHEVGVLDTFAEEGEKPNDQSGKNDF